MSQLPTANSAKNENPSTPLTDDIIGRQWDDLNELERDYVASDPMKLIAALQDKYGLSADEAARQVNEMLQNHKSQ